MSNEIRPEVNDPEGVELDQEVGGEAGDGAADPGESQDTGDEPGPDVDADQPDEDDDPDSAPDAPKPDQAEG